MQLELKPDLQSAVQYPVCNLLVRELIMHRRKQDGADSGNQIVRANHIAGPVEILPVSNYEFHFIVPAQEFNVSVVIVFLHSAGRAFEVHYFMHARIDLTQRHVPSRLEQNRVATLQKTPEELVHGLLQHRFPAGYERKACGERLDNLHDFVNRHFLRFVERILGIAVAAPKVTVGQPDESTWQPREGRLPLNTVEDFAYFHISSVEVASRQSPAKTIDCAASALRRYQHPIIR
jgi:hypothetical protein